MLVLLKVFLFMVLLNEGEFFHYKGKKMPLQRGCRILDEAHPVQREGLRILKYKESLNFPFPASVQSGILIFL